MVIRSGLSWPFPVATGGSPGMERNRYLDLLRVVAIGGVVYGHWLLISVTYRNGQLSGADALDYVAWARWVTWAFQVMPIFFVIGGYVDAQSWTAHHGDGQSWIVWVRDRVMRLWWPTAVFVVAGILAVVAAQAAGAGRAELAEAGWLVALQLWFLPVYMMLIAVTPVLLAAYRRWGLAVPVAMAAAAALVSRGVTGPHLHVIGYTNYLFVWGSIYLWGFAWADGTWTRARWRPYALAAAGGALLAGLVTSRAFQVDMIGSGNTNPPSIALLAYAAAQCGLVIAAEPAATRLLAKPRLWRRVRRLNATTMTVYLWHFVPVIIIAVAFYPTGVMPQPAIGTAQWWELRPAWWALLTVVLVPLVMAVMWAERPMRRLPAGIGPYGPWSPVLLVAGLAASMFGLARLAIAGFAPGGHLPALALAACAVGLAATLFIGRAPAAGAKPQAKGGRPSWRTVPTFAAGVLATAAGAVLVWCRGAGRADSGFHRPDHAVVGRGVAARRGSAGGLQRTGARQRGRPVRGCVQSPVQPGPDRAVAGAAGLAAGAGHARAVPDPAVRRGAARDRDDRAGSAVSRLWRDRHRGRPGPRGRALAAGLPGGRDLPGRDHRGVQGRRLHHRGHRSGAGRADRHPRHPPDLAAGAARDPRRPGARSGREPAAHQRPEPWRHGPAAGPGPGGHLLGSP
jgi:fucose 4-O-acetylase-like acetyltransferase